MKEVTKALADQKISGRRMVIEEVEGSEDEESTPGAGSAGRELSSNVESTDNHAQDLVNNTDACPTQELPTDEMKEQDSQVLLGGGDADGADTEAGSQARSVSAEGDTASPDDNMPPAALALKDAGNELFRKGQYGDALDKYNAAIQLLG